MRLFDLFLLVGTVAVFYNVAVDATCQYANESCTNTDYTLDGKCNDVNVSAAGSQNSPLGRTLTYLPTGGFGTIPFKNLIQEPLPEPRSVSMKVFPCHNHSEMEATHLFANFGKLLMADMFHVKRQSTVEECSSSTLGLNVADASDPRKCSSQCMNYYKPELTTNLDCSGDNINGINEKTHVIDASFLFDIPTESNGKIKTTNDFLPITNGAFTGIPSPLKENPLTVALFHVFVREYNKLVDKMTPFKQATAAAEAKKLLIAMFQHITYNEFLPKLLGAGTTAKALQNGNSIYDSIKKPIISHSTAVVFELLLASMSRDNVEIAPNTTKDIINILNNPTYINDDTKLTNIIRGMLKDKSFITGRQIPCEFRLNCTFSDVVSKLIQDSRVYGIPPYAIFLAVKDHNNILSFEDFPYHDAAEKTLLKSTYKTFYGVDALSGLFSEKKEANSNVGTLLKHVLELEFNGLRKGDRFFYEHPGVFQPHQLEQIRNVSLAHLLCRNVKNLDEVNQKAFQTVATSQSKDDDDDDGDDNDDDDEEDKDDLIHDVDDDDDMVKLNCSDLSYIDFCEYYNIDREWTEWKRITSSCRIVDILIRNCKSTNIEECSCEGIPFKTMPCETSLGSPDMKKVIEELGERLATDPIAMEYYKAKDYENLRKRAFQMYYNLKV